jgi:hypothetical protein
MDRKWQYLEIGTGNCKPVPNLGGADSFFNILYGNSEDKKDLQTLDTLPQL